MAKRRWVTVGSILLVMMPAGIAWGSGPPRCSTGRGGFGRAGASWGRSGGSWSGAARHFRGGSRSFTFGGSRCSPAPRITTCRPSRGWNGVGFASSWNRGSWSRGRCSTGWVASPRYSWGSGCRVRILPRPGCSDVGFWGVAGVPSAYYGLRYQPTYLYDDSLSIYEQGRRDALDDELRQLAEARARQLLDEQSGAFDEGADHFRAGRYDRALLRWLGAAELNHSDSAARLNAGLAAFAVGRFGDAVGHLARAFELSPQLPYRTFDLRDAYGSVADFYQHLSRLQQVVIDQPRNASAAALLGYVLYYTEGPAAARPALERAAKLDPKSGFIAKLLKVSRAVGDPSPAQQPARSTDRPGDNAPGLRVVQLPRPYTR